MFPRSIIMEASQYRITNEYSNIIKPCKKMVDSHNLQ